MSGGSLVSKDLQIPYGWSHKGNAGIFEGSCKPFILRQESISRMDRFDTILDANVHNLGNVQVLRYR